MPNAFACFQLAIATGAKRFLASSDVQAIVNDIYTGRIVYTTPSRSSVLADNYKPRPLKLYDVRTAPFLDHYRYVFNDGAYFRSNAFK